MATIKIPDTLPYDKTSAADIFRYSKGLLTKTLRDFVWEGYIPKKGKGGLGQMVENIYFFLETNSNPASDFSEAGLELKCTPLRIGEKGQELIKERLVCNMINYFEVPNEDFEHSHFFLKCQLMLLLFYLHQSNCSKLDLEFLYSVLWKIPHKDLIIIRHDYKIIRQKILNGEAHNLSEGDTEYLGACRKGQKGELPVAQPNSDKLAFKRAFSLKPAYMRTVLQYIHAQKEKAVTNIVLPTSKGIVTEDELRDHSLEEVLLSRLEEWYGKSIEEIMLHFNPNANLEDKGITYKAASLIASKGLYGVKGHGHIEKSEEFEKSGLRLKAIPLYMDGRVKESMSYENIDYCEIFNNDNWIDSTTYELFTSRFLFVVFQHPSINKGSFKGRKKEQILKRAFFWTMPQGDLQVAEEYWNHIRCQVVNNRISLNDFWNRAWSSENNKHFHVRPKGTITAYKNAAENPNGGKADKFCYWFNDEYVQKIIGGDVNETK